MSLDSLESALEVAAVLREPVRRRLYEYVASQPGPVGRDHVAAVLGLSRAAAAFHLDRLVEVGLLAIEYRRLSGRSGPGAGRPAKLYRRSGRMISLTWPRREYALLAGVLAGGGGPTDQDLERAHDRGQQLGQQAGGRSRRAVERVLGDLGFAPAADAGRTRTRSCPFEPLSRQNPPLVCGIGQALVEGIIEGAGARLAVASDEPGDGCCITLLANTG
jgi:predicted ArsR family transcriptional regulator